MGHRPQRDKRITTHVCLVARAFGADGVYLWREDEKIKKTIDDVTEAWGGDFFVRFKNYKRLLKEWKGLVVHLTMYGERMEKIEEIKKESENNDILVVVGAEKVPPEVYERADYNLSIGSQPHSEVAALALFLDRVLDESVLYRKFENAKMRIVPRAAGKKVLNLRERKDKRREHGT